MGFRDPPRDEPVNNNRSDPYSQNHNQQPYGQQPNVQPQATPAGDADPYAAFGGYQNYVALWYQSLQAQGQQGQQQGQAGPPG